MKRHTGPVAAALVLAACSSPEPVQSPPPPPATTTTEVPSAPRTGQEIVVTETDYRISLPDGNPGPGTHVFTVRNQGGDSHDLVIRGPGVDDARTPVIEPGGQGSVTATLQAGEYTLWCSVGNHRERGMETTLTVG